MQKDFKVPLGEQTRVTFSALKVFMSEVPGQRFSTKDTVNGFTTTVSGDKDGGSQVR